MMAFRDVRQRREHLLYPRRFLRNGQNGYIVNASGDYLQGYPVDDSGTLQTGTVSDIQIQTGNIPAEASDSLSFTANFDASDATIDRSTVAFDPTNSASYSDSYTTTVYDSLGNEHSVCQYFTKTSDNTWEVDYTFDGAAQDGAAPTTLTFDPNTGKLTSPTTPQTVEFTTDAAAPIELTVDYPVAPSTVPISPSPPTPRMVMRLQPKTACRLMTTEKFTPPTATADACCKVRSCWRPSPTKMGWKR